MLGQVPGLWDLQPDALLELSQLFDLKVYENETLCTEGDAPEVLWVLGVGCIEVIKQVPGKGPFLVAELQPTCLIGHSGVMALSKRTATLRARGKVEVLEMRVQSARVMLDTAEFSVASPFRRALIVAMCRQMGMATATVGRLASEAGIAEPADAEARLLRAEVGYPSSSGAGIEIAIEIAIVRLCRLIVRRYSPVEPIVRRRGVRRVIRVAFAFDLAANSACPVWLSVYSSVTHSMRHRSSGSSGSASKPYA